MLWIMSQWIWERCQCGQGNCSRWYVHTGGEWPLNVVTFDVGDVPLGGYR